MSKRNNISYVKPDDPSFLAKLKAQIGFKEGPLVDSKRQKLEQLSSGDEEPDEKPQVVVIKPGRDLSAEQVAAEVKRIAREEAEKPADLNQRILFKKRHTNNPATTKITAKGFRKSSNSKTRPSTSCNKLSFNEEEDE